MSDTDKASIFRGQKTIKIAAPTTQVTMNKEREPTSTTMTSEKTQSDSDSPAQNALNHATNSLSLSSLANALEPSSTGTKQQPAVGTFSQKAIPMTTQASPFGHSFGQPFTNTSNAEFSFSKAPPAGFAGFSSSPQTSATIPTLSFTNSSLQNVSSSNNNSQNVPSVMVMSSNTKREVSDQQSRFTPPKLAAENPNYNQSTENPQNGPTMMAKNSSNSQQHGMQSWASSKELEETADAPLSLADTSLLEKKIHSKLVDSSNLIVDRSDPTSPLFSLKSFQDLHLKPDLLKGVYSMGFEKPSKIQEIALPYLLGDPPKNIIAQSQSGTGKTAAFSLAILSRIDPSIPSVQALIISPTFELAIQIGSVIEAMAKFLPYVKVAYAVRQTTSVPMTTLVRGQLLTESIVIGTPGTIEDWCKKKKVINLRQLLICCVDEADVMIATEGFQQTCVNIVNQLNPSSSQIMLFSATYSDDVMKFAREIVPSPIVLRLKREKQTLNNIRQFFIGCNDAEHKYRAIQEIYNHLIIGQAIIFCRTKKTARDLHVRMANENHSVRELTAALDIEQRAAVIRQFRERIFNVLISTNVTARGIDVDDVSLVINYDMPVTVTYQPDYETYLHRIGRCGRFGRSGYTFNLISSDTDFQIMKSIEQYFQHPITEITIEQIRGLETDPE